MIVFDLQAIQSAAHGERGIARYVADLASALATNHPSVIDAFVINDRLGHQDRAERLPLGSRLIGSDELRGRSVDLLHVMSPMELLHRSEFATPVAARRLIVTCFDLIPLRFGSTYLSDPATRAAYLARLGLLQAADHIVTDSESASRDVQTLLGVSPSRTTSIGAGCSRQFCPPDEPHATRLHVLQQSIPGLRDRFVMLPVGMDWRKNIDGALDAFAILPSDLRSRHQLAIVCGVNDVQRAVLFQRCEKLGILDDVIVTGVVTDDDLVRLYQTTELVVFPSYYEGFGLPVLEARRCGARVISSNSSSLPEVLPAPTALFNPRDTEQLAEMWVRALTDEAYIAELDRAPTTDMTWEGAADQLVDLYEQVLRGVRARGNWASDRRDNTAPPRIAFVTVLPPTASGIADHSARLALELHERCELTVFVERQAIEISTGFPFAVESFTTLEYRWAAGEFDHVVYAIGNNHLHSAMLPLMSLVPGTALLHDVRLVGAANDAERRFDWTRLDDDPPELDSNGVDTSFATASATRDAASILVQSTHAADLVATYSGRAAECVGPHPMPTIATPVAEPTAAAPVTLISAGIAHPSKGTEIVATSFADLLGRHEGWQAALVGLGGEVFAQPPITVTGPVDDDQFDQWLRRATVAVQLRVDSNGESSGVVAHLLARGVPTIVSDIGAMRELPDDVVVKVPAGIDTRALSGVIEGLVTDIDRRAALHRAALGFAETETYGAQADRLIRALRRTQFAGG